jgi:hypothetical protein
VGVIGKKKDLLEPCLQIIITHFDYSFIENNFLKIKPPNLVTPLV